MDYQIMKMDVERVLALFKSDGLLNRMIPGFEARDAQVHMAQQVIQAYNENEIALIEAGTGTGKSMAYLIPAIIWASLTKERTVISTHTISLQEQLIHKDIPHLLKALNIQLKAVLVKGMNNYICLRKLAEVREELPLLNDAVAREITQIDSCKLSSQDGSKSKLPIVPSHAAWEKVCVEKETCTHRDCAFYESCYFFRARREASDAQLLVLNHRMLLSELSAEIGVLPPFTKVVLDEAHHLEDVATEHFASEVSEIGLLYLLSKLNSEKNGRLTLLKDRIYSQFATLPAKIYTAVHQKLTIDLPGMRQELIELIHHCFEQFASFLQHSSNDLIEEEKKHRILPRHLSDPMWKEIIIPTAKKLIESIKAYVETVKGLEIDLKEIKHERLEERTKSIRLEMISLITKFEAACEVIGHFIEKKSWENQVSWIERKKSRQSLSTAICNAELDVSKHLSELLFSKTPSIVLCSATLSSNNSFDFVRGRLGITQELKRACAEKIFPSPFNYSQQALFAIPTDIPEPIHDTYTDAAAENIWTAIQASYGGAFVLFTSYTQLQECYNLLLERLQLHRYVVLKQGESNRHSLLERFKSTERAVLFGTDSFWEGVDVVGDALRCVVIVKLPFKVPSDPLVQGRTESILEKGGNPFLDYTLPMAIVKFKQGFGRLIRNKNDRGCVVCLDNRILNKNYGKQVLNSLPDCQWVFAPSQQIHEKMKQFYRFKK